MEDKRLKISRRNLLKSSIVGALALSLNTRSIRPVLDEFFRLGIPVPWYRQGETKAVFLSFHPGMSHLEEQWGMRKVKSSWAQNGLNLHSLLLPVTQKDE